MASLSADEIAGLLQPFVVEAQATGADLPLQPSLLDQLVLYLDLLLRWNTRISLTSIRSAEEMVCRHFGESLFAGAQLARHVRPGAELLDYGSGAGFPGVPIQLLLPEIKVTLAESQTRKAAFLQEAIRVLRLQTEIWPKRVEEMPEGRRFDVVALRAVDRMETSSKQAAKYVRPGGWMVVLAGANADLDASQVFALPESERRRLLLWQPDVPRGT